MRCTPPGQSQMSLVLSILFSVLDPSFSSIRWPHVPLSLLAPRGYPRLAKIPFPKVTHLNSHVPVVGWMPSGLRPALGATPAQLCGNSVRQSCISLGPLVCWEPLKDCVVPLLALSSSSTPKGRYSDVSSRPLERLPVLSQSCALHP